MFTSLTRWADWEGQWSTLRLDCGTRQEGPGAHFVRYLTSEGDLGIHGVPLLGTFRVSWSKTYVFLCASWHFGIQPRCSCPNVSRATVA